MVYLRRPCFIKIPKFDEMCHNSLQIVLFNSELKLLKWKKKKKVKTSFKKEKKIKSYDYFSPKDICFQNLNLTSNQWQLLMIRLCNVLMQLVQTSLQNPLYILHKNKYKKQKLTLVTIDKPTRNETAQVQAMKYSRLQPTRK